MDKNDNKKENESPNLLDRRQFLTAVGSSALVISSLGAAAVSLDYLSPNVLFEPPLIFKEETPEDYQPGSVNLDADKKVFVVRHQEGYFYCMSAICTHLGCLTFWKADENLVACPCHGSRFDIHGEVVKGPAPRPLPHFSITLNDRGQLVVNKGETVPQGYILKV